MAQQTIILVDANGTRWPFEVTVLSDGNVASNLVLTSPTSGQFVTIDAFGNLAIQGGGSKSALNQTAAAVIKASPGRLRTIVVIAPGSTGGAFTLNDCTTTGAAAAANELWTLPYNGTANVAGAIFKPDLPCLVGLTLSAVPTGGSPVVAIFYD